MIQRDKYITIKSFSIILYCSPHRRGFSSEFPNGNLECCVECSQRTKVTEPDFSAPPEPPKQPISVTQDFAIQDLKPTRSALQGASSKERAHSSLILLPGRARR